MYQPIILFYSGDLVVDGSMTAVIMSLQFVGGGVRKTGHAKINRRTEGEGLIVVKSNQKVRWSESTSLKKSHLSCHLKALVAKHF